jgi:TRAP-type transport system small permease protein
VEKALEMRRFFLAIDALLAALLFGMVVMVFGNVFLRYLFNSGIDISEELSRFFFVWLTFIGAIVALKEGTHLGMDNVVSRLSRHGKLVCLAICQVLIILCCVILVWGTWDQHEVNATTSAPVTGLSMIWVFGVGYITGTGMIVTSLHTLWRIASGRITDRELVAISESEDVGHPSDADLPAGSLDDTRARS